MICESCEGTGEIPCTACVDLSSDIDTECEVCSGIGFIICSECGGTGELGEIEA